MTPAGDFKLDLDQAAFVAETGFRALNYKAQAKKQEHEAKHAKMGWLRDWSEKQQARKERLATEQYDRIKDDLPTFIDLWKQVESELETLNETPQTN
jgi:hypothetical protein